MAVSQLSVRKSPQHQVGGDTGDVWPGEGHHTVTHHGRGVATTGEVRTTRATVSHCLVSPGSWSCLSLSLSLSGAPVTWRPGPSRKFQKPNSLTWKLFWNNEPVWTFSGGKIYKQWFFPFSWFIISLLIIIIISYKYIVQYVKNNIFTHMLYFAFNITSQLWCFFREFLKDIFILFYSKIDPSFSLLFDKARKLCNFIWK